MNRLYEGMFLFDANVASRDWPGLERHVGDLLEKHGASLVYSERWPDRKLAYEIRGVKKGTYYLTYFDAPTGAISALHRDCQLSDRVLRLMVIQDEGIQEELERRRARHEAGEDAVESSDEFGGGDEESSRPRRAAPVKSAADDSDGRVGDDDGDRDGGGDDEAAAS